MQESPAEVPIPKIPNHIGSRKSLSRGCSQTCTFSRGTRSRYCERRRALKGGRKRGPVLVTPGFSGGKVVGALVNDEYDVIPESPFAAGCCVCWKWDGCVGRGRGGRRLQLLRSTFLVLRLHRVSASVSRLTVGFVGFAVLFF